MKCPKFGFEVTELFKESRCLNCPDRSECFVRPRFGLGKIDVFKLAEGLVKKRKWESLPQWAREGSLGECPKCHEISLWYDKRAGRYECMNKECQYSDIIRIRE